MDTIYKCSTCGEEFHDPAKCKDHERKAHIPLEAIPCPTCHGEGGYEGTDGCDWRQCYTCDGVGKVIPRIKSGVVYEKI